MMRSHEGVPLVGIAAASGTGKTTLLRRVIPLLDARGLRVGCVKHTHHPFEIDRPGKDSYLLRAAGARQMLLGSAGRWALMVETGDAHDAPLAELVRRLDIGALDVVLVEGFRLEDIPKIALLRAGCEAPPVNPGSLLALATNLQPPPAADVPVLDLDRPESVADFIAAYVRDFDDLHPAPTTA